jgi:hypothetical protein
MTVDLVLIGCMAPLSSGRPCTRPVQYVSEGTSGPFYHCGKCGNKLASQRDDVNIIRGETKLV